jgi:hypothetical protein
MGVNVDGDQVLMFHKNFQKFGKTLCLLPPQGQTI